MRAILPPLRFEDVSFLWKGHGNGVHVGTCSGLKVSRA
jgi:hypothetical protein